ncbi:MULTISPECIES: hypothetical protein [Nonomuraea]|jgi:hypothetical protein|uniref:Uncharacterized protein n=3 Tax=Nonomuraea TaxID=83681 RepID=A0ABR9KEW2_9ACTN|nr:hypothetical protein [Nonomuraea africana]MBE1560552.1 hypothetical protein [Nonomuraea africana]
MTEKKETEHVKELIDALYTGQERLSRLEINERMTAADLPADLMAYFDRLPDGDYEQEELVETLNQMILDRGEERAVGQIPEI